MHVTINILCNSTTDAFSNTPRVRSTRYYMYSTLC